MITELDEAIKHCKEAAEKNRKEADEWYAGGCSFAQAEGNDCLECAKDHEQLAEWLTELEADRELLCVIRSIVWDNSLYDGIKIDKLRRLLSVYEESEAEND